MALHLSILSQAVVAFVLHLLAGLLHGVCRAVSEALLQISALDSRIPRLSHHSAHSTSDRRSFVVLRLVSVQFRAPDRYVCLFELGMNISPGVALQEVSYIPKSTFPAIYRQSAN